MAALNFGENDRFVKSGESDRFEVWRKWPL